MKTTLDEIRKHNPCAGGWEKLLKYLGKTKADDEPLAITTILDSNGLQDALWCLRAVEGYDREIRLYAVWCARQVQHLLKDQRSIDAIDVAEKYANGQATQDELDAARDDAWSAAGAARYAAMDVAWSAAWHAADAAARVAAWGAVRAAREGVVWWDDAYVAAKANQEAELRRICGEG